MRGTHCSCLVVTKPFDLTTDLKSLVSFVNGVGATGGGDTPEAYELCLREAQKLSWRKDAGNKALVIIGDAPPHPPSYTTEKIWWRDELKKLMKMGVKVYGVQCGADPSTKVFFEEMATDTGGVYLGTLSDSISIHIHTHPHTQLNSNADPL